MKTNKFENIAYKIRTDIIQMLATAGSGHPGGALSVTDILVLLYFKHLTHDPKNSQWEGRDRVVLSKGHVCPALYATLSAAGYFPRHRNIYRIFRPGPLGRSRHGFRVQNE
jgi:transketolase